MKDRCRVCGSKDHGKDNSPHRNARCEHCTQDGHWSTVCLRKLQGLAPGPPKSGKNAKISSAAVTEISSPATNAEAEAAKLKDLIETQNKQIKFLSDQMNLKSF